MPSPNYRTGEDGWTSKSFILRVLRIFAAIQLLFQGFSAVSMAWQRGEINLG